MKFVPLVVVAGFAAAHVSAQEEKSRATEHTLEALPHSSFFVVPPRTAPPAGKQGPLLVVLPGGDGSREFLPFVENGIAGQAPDDCTVVLVTAVQWQKDQDIVWPTSKSKVPGMQYTTEDYVRAVVADVEKTQPIDPARRVVLAWSSSGPAIYPLLAAKDSPFARGYVAMSIWPKGLDLGAVKGRRFVVDQSIDDRTTPFSHAREASVALGKAGAAVRLSIYEGGHGWQDSPLPRLREGLRWLLSDEPAPKVVWPEPEKAASRAKLANVLLNGGFEAGLEKWQVHDQSKHFTAEVVKNPRKEGKQSLHVAKKGEGLPDAVTQVVPLNGAAKVTCCALVKSKGATDASIRVFLFGDGDQPLNNAHHVAYVAADADWRDVERTWPAEGARRAIVQITLFGQGELWVDDVVLAVVK